MEADGPLPPRAIADDISARIRQKYDCYDKYQKACMAEGGDSYECLRLGIIYCDDEYKFETPTADWAKPYTTRDEGDHGEYMKSEDYGKWEEVEDPSPKKK